MHYAYDVAQLKDSALDNGVRDTAEASKKFDRDNPCSQVYSLIFPQHILPIINKHFGSSSFLKIPQYIVVYRNILTSNQQSI